MSQLLQHLRASGILDEQALQSAMRRQQIYGGSLDTVLLELDLLDAPTLSKAIAAANECDAVPVVLLEPGPERPWDALPQPLLDLGWAMPLRRHMAYVQVAIHPEIPAEQRKQLELAVEHLQVFTTCEACLAKLAAERRASVMPQRYAVLAAGWMQTLERLQPKPKLAPEPEPAAPSAPWMTASSNTAPYKMAKPQELTAGKSDPVFRPAADPGQPLNSAGKPAGAVTRSPTFLYGLPVGDDDDDELPPVTSEPAPAPAASPIPESAPDEDSPTPRPTLNRGVEVRPSASLQERLASPRGAIEAATTRDLVTEALVRAAMILSPRVALFGIKHDGLHGLDTPGQIPGTVDQLVEYSPKIEAAVEGIESLERVTDLDLRIAVGQEMAVPCMFLAIKVHDRPVLMLYLDRDGDPFTAEEIEAGFDLCEGARQALEGVLRRMRGESGPSTAAQSSAAPPAISPPRQAAAPLSSALESPLTSPLQAPPSNPGTFAPPGKPGLFAPPGGLLFKPPGAAKPFAGPAGGAGAAPTPPIPSTPTAGPSGPNSVPARPPTPSSGIPPVRAKPPIRQAPSPSPSPPAPAIDKPPVRRPPTEVAPAVPEAPPSAPTEPEAPSTAPALTSLSPPFGQRDSGSMRGRIQLDEEDRPRKPDSKLKEIDAAILSATRGDSSAIQTLRELGEPAMRRFAKQFPGELDVHRRDLDTLPPLPAHGALIRVALDLGPALGPYLVDVIHHPNPTVRFYIAFVFMELRHELAIPALGELAFDPDADVRAIAMRVLETYSDEPGFDNTIKLIRAELDSPNRTRQLHSTRAIGTVRDIAAVSKLIELLTSKERYIQEASLESLCSITGQQLGLKPHRWHGWYADNHQHHRIEWIMSSLAHKDLSVRRWAADELRRITGQRINFLAAGNKQEREIGIHKWIEWWSKRGRAEFS